MNQDIKTIELAKVYESQGYFQDALDIYTFLDGKETSNSIQAAIKRMEKRVQEDGHADSQNENASDKMSELDKINVSNSIKVSDSIKVPDNIKVHGKNRVPLLIEQWLMLMVLKQRLSAFKKIKARF
jgi:hypothetical protein